MDIEKLKQLDARRLKPREFEALSNILRGRPAYDDEVIIQTVIDREFPPESGT